MEVKQANNIAHITTRDLIILVLVFVLTLPLAGFKFAEWWFVTRDDSYVMQVTREAAAVVSTAQQAKKSYIQEKGELVNQPALCPLTSYYLLKRHEFPLKRDQ